MAGRFDYVRYDEHHTEIQRNFKGTFESLEADIDQLEAGRARDLALVKLEECYMWIGKAIRDQQITFGGSAEDVPERGDGMLPHQQRVIAERDELYKKYDALCKFIAGPNAIFDGLPEDEKKRLCDQRDVMGSYYHILRERIAAFS